MAILKIEDSFYGTNGLKGETIGDVFVDAGGNLGGEFTVEFSFEPLPGNRKLSDDDIGRLLIKGGGNVRALIKYLEWALTEQAIDAPQSAG